MTSALALAGITKSFPGVRALKGVSFSLQPGEIRALVGENGAGKSTLMKILSGAYSADEGRIELFGEAVLDPTPAGMISRGVAVIYQELAQAPHLTVAENVLMGRLPCKGALIDWGEAKRRTIEVIDRLGFDVDPTARIGTLSVAKRQMVEIAKALARNARIIVLDEPSAVLAQAEIDQLFRVVRQLARESGVAFVYISHRLREVFELSDTVTVLRDGTVIHNGPSNGLTTDDLIRSMVGREVGDVFPNRTPRIGEEALSAQGISTPALLKNVSIHVRKGEIVGLFGLAGAGRTELLRAIYGADTRGAGEVRINGAMASIASPRAGISKGLGLVPEDRKTEGLFLIQSVGFNIMSASLAQIVRFGLLSLRRERKIVNGLIERLRIRTPNAAAATQNLSGGNQQKCVLARLVSAGCEILLADEPTRGVDVGAKREIYDLLVELAEARGLAIVIASSELPEILGLCDRLYVLREGEVTAELDARTATEEDVMHFAALH
ncbi:sugar ABC transporter ATP-binding protein [Rhizobium leguminosarum]|uniref:sugar ABC transporter ATP-binding protein n=1 Tax=Rhizobium TaxID=379 RepID=UPI0010306E1A|nr:sugar ABC transporter ATP-binding protein [Rhizobium leguminosarum]TAV88372.1 sugar ABC transporter ATP-binding protein [Rhizobium leguminosarum]TAV92955.1 sugar ABC transporter ATP-binding protein [Rhizobium leguminosarum]TAW34026.1 sugar ABC transporter ATP-binding protein [Rhizobium leguminosarum]